MSKLLFKYIFLQIKCHPGHIQFCLSLFLSVELERYTDVDVKKQGLLGQVSRLRKRVVLITVEITNILMTVMVCQLKSGLNTEY